MSSSALELPTCDPQLFEDTAAVLRVCGHPTRWRILCLIERQSACVMDLWKCLDQPQPVISQHLAALKERGIVEALASGNRRVYSIRLPLVRRLVQDFLAQAEDGVNACLA